MLLDYYQRPDVKHKVFIGWLHRVIAHIDDGYFYISGEIKEMIKHSEENISAHEVESALI
jgi:acyl-coenzyme A synthetase/AMP-(fatty) acid ligase